MMSLKPSAAILMAQRESCNHPALSDPHNPTPESAGYTILFADKQNMDLVTAAVNMQQANLIGQVQILVARKILDAEQDQGSAAIKLIDAATSGVDQAGNALIAATSGLGGQLDVTA